MNTCRYNRPLRQYEPIWIALKSNVSVSVAIPEKLQKRVIQAVMKEKWKDTEHRFILGEKGKEAKMSYKRNGNLVTFYLSISIGLEDL